MKTGTILAGLLGVCAWAILGCGVSRGAEAPVELKVQLPKPCEIGTRLNHKGDLAPSRKGIPIFVPTGATVNLALKKPVKASVREEDLIEGKLAQLTDGDREGAEGHYLELPPGTQWVQVDLGQTCELHAILLWHFLMQYRVFKGVIVQVCDDADFITGVKTLFNNDQENAAGQGIGGDKLYVEELEGKYINAKGAKGRYVRVWGNGDSSGDTTHFIELEVYGLPVK